MAIRPHDPRIDANHQILDWTRQDIPWVCIVWVPRKENSDHRWNVVKKSPPPRASQQPYIILISLIYCSGSFEYTIDVFISIYTTYASKIAGYLITTHCG
jgi:hypothetical protein